MKNDETVKVHWLDRQAEKFEQSRFGAMTLMMTAQSCWASVAAMFALKVDNIILLALCAAFTMASNAAFIAQSPAKWCLTIFYVSIVANLLILIASLISLS